MQLISSKLGASKIGPRGNLDLSRYVLHTLSESGFPVSPAKQDFFPAETLFVLLSFQQIINDRRLDFGFSPKNIFLSIDI